MKRLGFEIRPARAVLVVSNRTDKRLRADPPEIQMANSNKWIGFPDAWQIYGIIDPNLAPHESRVYILWLPAGKCRWRSETHVYQSRERWIVWLRYMLQQIHINTRFDTRHTIVRTDELSLEP
jgi:hypothetical protein